MSIRSILTTIATCLCIALTVACGSQKTATKAPEPDPKQLTWLSIEEAAQLMKKKPRKILVDVYTDWCGWCKRMDSVTFSDPEVIKYINAHFYAVKLNAENPAPITFNGKKYEFVNNGRRGYHAFAAYLLSNQMGYPSFAFIDEKLQPIQAFAGFKPPDAMAINMRFIAEDHYKKISWRNYATDNGLK
jgi:thioredoxin-related protein